MVGDGFGVAGVCVVMWTRICFFCAVVFLGGLCLLVYLLLICIFMFVCRLVLLASWLSFFLGLVVFGGGVFWLGLACAIVEVLRCDRACWGLLVLWGVFVWTGFFVVGVFFLC